jgi:2-oxoglutarate ferredoxin oxidoreductase subunit alpha
MARYSERPADHEALMDRLTHKLDTARKFVPQPEVRSRTGAAVGIIAYGSSHVAVEESLVQLEREFGIEASYFRIRALPFTGHLREFLRTHERLYVVEQNRDGQMADLVTIEVPEFAARLRKILHYNGLPIDARFITDHIVELESERANQ